MIDLVALNQLISLYTYTLGIHALLECSQFLLECSSLKWLRRVILLPRRSAPKAEISDSELNAEVGII